ncbi:MAG: methyltransferase, partial [Pseudomonadales bacterium]
MTQTLTRGQARRFYDRLGAFQDRQAFYEDKALDVLVEHGRFSEANRVLEIGCGTGRLAARLLSDHLPSSAQYLALDQSPTMVSLAQQGLEQYRERGAVRLTDGGVKLPTAA